MYKNHEGYPDPTQGKAIREADKPPEEVRHFRLAMKLMCRDLPCQDPGKGNGSRQKGTEMVGGDTSG